MITSTQVNAAIRHVVSFAAGAITVGATIHILTPLQAQELTKAFSDIGEGVGTILAILGPLATLISGWFAAKSASPKAQAASLAALPEVKQIVADPKIADAVPSDKVVTP